MDDVDGSGSRGKPGFRIGHAADRVASICSGKTYLPSYQIR
jgi:hypothetical protein